MYHRHLHSHAYYYVLNYIIEILDDCIYHTTAMYDAKNDININTGVHYIHTQ